MRGARPGLALAVSVATVLGGCPLRLGGPEGAVQEDAAASHAAPTTSLRGDAHVGDGVGDARVVATVDGRPITLGEVRDVARTANVAPLEALRRIEDERVLEQLAAPEQDDAEVRAATRRAAVRAYLAREIEAAHRPEDISDEAIEARHTEIAARLVQPETRRATHLLVGLERDASPERVAAAERIARQLLAEAAVSPTSDGLAALAGRRGAFDVRVEHLPLFAAVALEEPFARALFALPAPTGTPVLAPDVVRSSFGFHVILLEEVAPPWVVPEDEWRPVVRRQLAVEARAEAVAARVAELAQRTTVAIDPAGRSLAESFELEGPGRRRDGASGEAQEGAAER